MGVPFKESVIPYINVCKKKPQETEAFLLAFGSVGTYEMRLSGRRL